MKKAVIFLFFIMTFSLDGIAQCEFTDFSEAPKELFRKRVVESGMRYGNPYTMFVKNDNFNFENSIGNIINNLISEIPKTGDDKYFKQYSYSYLYKGIWEIALLNEPSKCNESCDCEHPKWVKDNAIIYLVGLKYDTTALGKDTFKLMTQTERDVFFERTHQGLRNLNPNVISCYGGEDCKKVHLKAFDLIQYLQAYDLLKTGGGLPAYDNDKNGGNCTARNKLRQFARNLYAESNNIINSNTGWKKNHGIICASALGMAAIVLNDAGVETNWFNGIFGFLWGDGINLPHPKFSPIKWYERSHGTDDGQDNLFNLITWGEDGLEDNFFVGDHMFGYPDVPQSDKDGATGYAEGPGYFNYLSTAFFPLVRTADNFLPEYNPKNYLHNYKYNSIIHWAQNILNHDLSIPTYDNTDIEHHMKHAILGTNEFFGNTEELVSGTFDLRGDYIFALGDRPIQEINHYQNDLSGNIKYNFQSDSSIQTFHLLYESQTAIDKASYILFNEGTHEDDDMGSFMVQVTPSSLASS